MSAPPVRRRWPTQLFRIATLLAPSALAAIEVFSQPRRHAPPHLQELASILTWTLAPLWVLVACGLVARTVMALLRRRRDAAGPLLAQIDVLTSAGSTLAWLSAFAIMLSVWVGWASLASVGLLGTALFHVVVLATFIATRGDDPIGRRSVSRRFTPEIVTEGDVVVEELRFTDVRIPLGFRLFATGRIGPRWPSSRHVIDAAGAAGEIVIETELGPAVRGEHDVEPLEMWLQDSFGLCRSLRVRTEGSPRLTVLPRLLVAEKTAPLLDLGEGPREPRPTKRLPTEGLFQLREYQPGDDVRRIHWVKSQVSGELVVRLPDEIPPDQPRMTLVLDTFLPQAYALPCDAHAELLDSLVAVWLAVGTSLAKQGTLVTLVSAIPDGNAIVTARHRLSLRTPPLQQRLGARIAWQAALPADRLVGHEATLVITRAIQPLVPIRDKTRFIVVPPAWVSAEPPWPQLSPRLPFPMGSPDNRWSRRREARRKDDAARTAHRAFMALRGDLMPGMPGSFLALPGYGGSIRIEPAR